MTDERIERVRTTLQRSAAWFASDLDTPDLAHQALNSLERELTEVQRILDQYAQDFEALEARFTAAREMVEAARKLVEERPFMATDGATWPLLLALRTSLSHYDEVTA